MSAETFKKYGDTTIYHHGPTSADYNALVLGARYDSGVKLGPDGEPALTLLYLDPTKAQNGPLRGNLLDAAVVVHDVPYLSTEDLTAVGYSDTAFDYPVPVTPTIEEQLASAQAQISEMQAEIAKSKTPAVVAPAAPAITPAEPPAPAAVKTEPVVEPAAEAPVHMGESTEPSTETSTKVD